MTKTDAFHVPEDLAKLDLTLTEVREILANRKKLKSVAMRLAALPAKGERYTAWIKELGEREQALLQEALQRRAAAAAAEAEAVASP